MKKVVSIAAIGFTILIGFNAVAHSASPKGDLAPIYMMGGGMGGGGMGGHGMMGPGRGIMDLMMRFLDPNKESEKEAVSGREELRFRIQEKRWELASLLRSEDPDKDLIDKKIEELNRLEGKLDREMSDSN